MYDYTEIYGLLYGCPFSVREEECPFKQFDNFSFEKKIKLFEKLDNKVKNEMLDNHRICSQRRDKKYKRLVS